MDDDDQDLVFQTTDTGTSELVSVFVEGIKEEVLSEESDVDICPNEMPDEKVFAGLASDISIPQNIITDSESCGSDKTASPTTLQATETVFLDGSLQIKEEPESEENNEIDSCQTTLNDLSEASQSACDTLSMVVPVMDMNVDELDNKIGIKDCDTMKKSRCYSQTDLERAVNSVREGGLRIREAAKRYGIPFSTLQRRCRWGIATLLKPGPNPALGTAVENIIVEAVGTLLEMGFRLTGRDIMKMAKEIDKSRPRRDQVFKKARPSNSWCARFKERHKIVLRTSEDLSVTGCELWHDIFQKYVALVEEHGLTADDIFRMNENHLQAVKVRDRVETMSVVIGANASATVITPAFVIFKGNSLITCLNPTDYPDGTLFAHSSSGNMVTDVFLEWMKLFVAHIRPKRPVLLIVDSYVGHVSYEILQFAWKNQIILLRLSSQTPNWFQSEGVELFTELKTNFRNMWNVRMDDLDRKSNPKDLGETFTSAWSRSVTPEKIKKEFERGGIWPIKEDAKGVEVEIISVFDTECITEDNAITQMLTDVIKVSNSNTQSTSRYVEVDDICSSTRIRRLNCKQKEENTPYNNSFTLQSAAALHVGKFVVVIIPHSVNDSRSIKKRFVAKVVKTDADSCVCSLMREGKLPWIFIFPSIEDLIEVKTEQIVKILDDPVIRQGRYIFDDDEAD